MKKAVLLIAAACLLLFAGYTSWSRRAEIERRNKVCGTIYHAISRYEMEPSPLSEHEVNVAIDEAKEGDLSRARWEALRNYWSDVLACPERHVPPGVYTDSIRKNLEDACKNRDYHKAACFHACYSTD
jgi:hypothetical protein